MDLTRSYPRRILWSVWAGMVLITLLGLVRYLERAELPFEARRTDSGFIVVTDSLESAHLPLSWPGTTDGLLVEEVNGFAVGNPWDVRLALAGQSRGDEIEVRLAGSEEPLTGVPAVHTVILEKGWDAGGLIVYSLLALLSLGLAAVLIRERNRHPAAISLAVGLVVLGSSIALDEFGAPLRFLSLGFAPGVLWSLIFPLLPAAALSFDSRFPTESPFWRRWPWIRTAGWCLAWPIGIGTAAGSLLYIGADGTRNALTGLTMVRICQHALWIMLVISVVLMLHGLLSAWRSSEEWTIRNRVRWVLLGIALGGIPPLLMVWLPRLVGWQEMQPNWLAVSFLVLIPLSFTVAVIRHQLLDISVVIRQGLMYGPATFGVSLIFGSVFFVILLLLIRELVPSSDISLDWGYFVAFVISAFLFSLVYEPLRKRYWRWVDRRFFRTKYTYGRSVREFNEKLAEALTGDVALTRLLEMVLKTMNPRWVIVIDTAGRWREEWEPVQEPGAGADPEESIPLPELEGLELRLGPKRSGMAYHDYDRALLTALAGLTSTALRRELLQRELLEEQTETERLTALNHLKDDFLSLVSHDLRSPLAAIMLGADLMVHRSQDSEDDQNRSDAIRIKRNAQRMGQMVERILHSARVEAGRVEPDIGPVNLTELASVTFERHELLADNAGVALDSDIPEDAVVASDPILLQEAVSNLVDNALKVSESGMSVRLAAEREDTGWALTVSDDGPGIPEEKLGSLFEKGGLTSTGQRTAGFGLGLYLVHQLVKLVGGTLELRETSARGTTFEIHLQPWTDDEDDPDS